MPQIARPLRRVLWALVVVCGLGTIAAGQERFEFVISATDAAGDPVTNLTPDEVVMSEDGAPATALHVEPFPVPVKLTIAVDNGPDSRDALAHYRNGLAALVKTLPFDVEVTLIATAPQPRMVVPPTTDRIRILRGVNGFAPQEERPRFTDALVEYSQRLQRELREERVEIYLPVLLMVSTTATEATSYEVPEIARALDFLAARKARLFVVMLSTSTGNRLDVNVNRQSLIAIPTVKATRGRYEAIAISNRLTSLLPEIGETIADLHAQHVNQLRVTVERAAGLQGAIRNPSVELMRPGLSGIVSVDGLP